MEEMNNMKTAATNTRLHEASLSQELEISSQTGSFFNGVLMTGLETNFFL